MNIRNIQLTIKKLEHVNSISKDFVNMELKEMIALSPIQKHANAYCNMELNHLEDAQMVINAPIFTPGCALIHLKMVPVMTVNVNMSM